MKENWKADLWQLQIFFKGSRHEIADVQNRELNFFSKI